MGINIEELSKYKYIYRVYSSEDNVIHCEKYPVIYANCEIVYFKDARKKEYLNYTTFRNVRDEYIGITNKDLNYCGYYDKYFWKVENFDSKKATQDVFEQKNKSELADAKADLERVEREYRLKMEKYNKLNSKL